MHFLFLVFYVFTIVLSGSHGVHPGDPFPDRFPIPKTFDENEVIISNDKSDPSDDIASSKIPVLIGPSDSIDDGDDDANSFDLNMFISTKPSMIEKLPEQKIKNESNSIKSVQVSSDNPTTITTTTTTTSSTESSTSMISRKNSIKIARWRYDDAQSKTSRYWYEPEGGRMGLGWTFDGYIFQAYSKPVPHTEPVYSFHSEIRGMWTNTIQLDPRPPVIGESQWISDGISFYAHKTPMNSTDLRPVFRYWNRIRPSLTNDIEVRSTYLTIKVEEEDNNNIVRTDWIFDNILFYVLPFDEKLSMN